MSRLFASMMLFVLIASACGSTGSDDSAVADPRVLTGEANVAQLDFTGSIDTTEMIDVRTGAVTSLDEQVTGDRAVVLWYWAPD